MFLLVYGITIALTDPLQSLHVGIILMIGLICIRISLSDLVFHEIPSVPTTALALFGAIELLLTFSASAIATLTLAAVVLVGLWWFGHLHWNRTGREALGIGDAKLLAAGTLMVGAERFWLMLLLASLGGIVAAVISRKGREEGIPFGPFIAYAIFVIFLMPDPVP